MSKPLTMSDILNSPLANPREEMSAKNIFDTPDTSLDMREQPREQPSMNIHIEIQKVDKNGNFMNVVADIDNRDDLLAFNETYKEYLPRKKWMGLI